MHDNGRIEASSEILCRFPTTSIVNRRPRWRLPNVVQLPVQCAHCKTGACFRGTIAVAEVLQLLELKENIKAHPR